MTAKNRQWTTKQDGLDNLELGETNIPEPKDGEVLVKIKAVSLNYRDTEVCQGEYTHHSSLDNGQPLVPCSDMAGEIVASKSPRWNQTGARVLSIFNQTHLTGQIKESDLASGLGFPLPGVLAQYRVFPDYALVPIPDYLSDEEACTLPIAAVTAWTSINGFRPLGEYLDLTSQTKTKDEKEKKPPPVLLAQGTGGVSVAALQIAHAAGLATIVTSSSDDKLDRARKELGASTGINYRTHWEWHEFVLEATAGNGADYILETGGADTLRRSFACVAFGGTIACIGYLSGKDEDESSGDGGLNRLNVNVLALRRNATLRGILNGPRDRFEEMLGFYEKKGIRPVVDKVFKFEEAKEAFQYLAKGAHFGKVVIKVAD